MCKDCVEFCDEIECLCDCHDLIQPGNEDFEIEQELNLDD